MTTSDVTGPDVTGPELTGPETDAQVRPWLAELGIPGTEANLSGELLD